MPLVKNTSLRTVVLYSNDGDSLELIPKYIIPIDDKFISNLPKKVVNESIPRISFKEFGVKTTQPQVQPQIALAAVILTAAFL